MIVVSDTSPIGSLILIERLELLPAIFGQVLIPEKVFTELLVLETDFGPFLVFPIKAKSFQTKPKRGGILSTSLRWISEWLRLRKPPTSPIFRNRYS